MENNLSEPISLLARTPATLNALLRDLPDTWTLCNEGDKTWSAFDVVGHLIITERTAWMPRIKNVLQFGVARAFDPVDRFAQIEENRGKSLHQLLDHFARSRSESLDELRALNLQPADFHRRGLHPALGEVKLSNVVSAWTCHDLTHLHQISRIMAHQYREAVGAWTKYLGVLHCGGHGEP
jgi:hypothetical protein